MRKAFIILSLTLFTGINAQANEVLEQLLAEYQKEANSSFTIEAGQVLWKTTTLDPESNTLRQCADCHTADLTAKGKHVKTSKDIPPLAPSVNPKSLTDVRQIEKWLLRNCKWTLGRECTAQEKGDLLTFINAQ
jgi:cytochrome c553